MSVRRGTYVLAVYLGAPRRITVGALGTHDFAAGLYLYAGSAMGGLDQRLRRHLSREKTVRWHIDYLTTVCDRSEAYESYPDPVPECGIARTIEACGGIPEMAGFGCSDCRCWTHLFRADGEILAQVVARCSLGPHRAREPL